MQDLTIQDAPEAEATETQAPDPVLTILKEIQGKQTTLENRVGYLLREAETAKRQGQPFDPALHAKIDQLNKELTANKLADMDAEQQRDYYKTQAEAAEAKASQGTAPLSQQQIEAIGGRYFQEEAVPMIEDFCEAGGINLTKEMWDYINTVTLHVDTMTGTAKPAQFNRDVAAYLKQQQKLQQAAAKKTTPAEEAADALGDGARGGGNSKVELDFMASTPEDLLRAGFRQMRRGNR